MDKFTEDEAKFFSSNQDEEKLIRLRIKALDIATNIATQAKKPTHAPYIAANIYKFLLTGEGPVFEKRETEDTKEQS